MSLNQNLLRRFFPLETDEESYNVHIEVWEHPAPEYRQSTYVELKLENLAEVPPQEEIQLLADRCEELLTEYGKVRGIARIEVSKNIPDEWPL